MTGRSKELSEIIQAATKEMEEIRKICEHKQFHECNYSWRIGCIEVANVCDDCGEYLGYVRPFEFQKLQFKNFKK